MLQHNIEQRFKIYSSNVFSTYVSDCRDVWSWAFGCLLRVLFRLRYDAKFYLNVHKFVIQTLYDIIPCCLGKENIFCSVFRIIRHIM